MKNDSPSAHYPLAAAPLAAGYVSLMPRLSWRPTSGAARPGRPARPPQGHPRDRAPRHMRALLANVGEVRAAGLPSSNRSAFRSWPQGVAATVRAVHDGPSLALTTANRERLSAYTMTPVGLNQLR